MVLPSPSWSAPGMEAGNPAWRPRIRFDGERLFFTRSRTRSRRLSQGDHTSHPVCFVALLICWFNAELRSAQEGLRYSESNLRSLVTNAPYGICRCDSTGILLDVNPALVTTLGYALSSELAGRNLANLYKDTEQWFDLADYLRSLTRYGLVAEWMRKDGSSVIVRLSGRAIRGERNAIFFELSPKT